MTSVFKVVAASIIAVWLVLLGIEFSEAAGFVNRVDKDEAIESETASFGVAFRVLDRSRLTLLPTLTVQPQVIDTTTAPGLCSLGVASYLGKESQFLKGHFKIHKLQRVFLI